jgi:hypothetical protein
MDKAQLIALAQQKAAEYGLDPELFVKQLDAESSFNPKAIGPLTRFGNAKGIAQFLDSTAKQYGVNQFDAVSSIEGAARYMADLTKQFGDQTKAMAAYNWGPGNLQKHLQDPKSYPLPTETSQYLTKIANVGAVPMQAGAGSGSQGIGMMREEGATLNALSGHVLEMMRAIVGDSTKAASNASDALASKTAGLQTSLTAKTDAANAEEENKRKLLNTASADMFDPTSAIARAQQDALMAGEVRSKLEGEIQQLQSVNPLEDPLGWFVSQIKLNAVGKKWDVATQTEQNAHRTVSSIQQRVEAQTKIQPALVAGMRVRALQGEQQVAVAEAELQKSEVESRLRQEQMGLLRTELLIGSDKFSRELQLRRMQQDEDQFQAAKAEKLGQKANLTRSNSLIAMYGGQPLLNENDRRAYGPEGEDRLAKASRLGGTMGATPGEVVANMQIFGDLGAVRKQRPELATVISVLQEAGKKNVDEALRNLASPEAAAVNKMSPTQRLEWGVNKQWEKWREEAGKKSMDQLSPDNPFKLNMEAAATAPALAGNKFAQYVTERMKAGGKAPDEKELFGAAIAMLEADPPAPQQLVMQHLSEFFQRGVRHQTQLFGWDMMGADLSDPQKGNKTGEFRYRINPANMTGGRGLLDWGPVEKDLNVMNPGELQNLVVKMRKQRQQSVTGNQGQPLFDTLFGQPNITPIEQQRIDNLAAAKQRPAQ